MVWTPLTSTPLPAFCFGNKSLCDKLTSYR
jgi:hypothetical protein